MTPILSLFNQLFSNGKKSFLSWFHSSTPLKEQEDDVKAQLMRLKPHVRDCMQRQGRNSRFKNKSERISGCRKRSRIPPHPSRPLRAVKVQTTEDIKELESDITGFRTRDREPTKADRRQRRCHAVYRATSADCEDERDSLMDQRK